MERDLNHRIFSLRAELSPQLTRLADYILAGEARVCFLNARQLAAAAAVSAPTVIRFVRRLGYRGFLPFRSELQKNAQRRMAPAQRQISSAARRRNPVSIESLVREEILCIENSQRLIRPADFDAAVEHLCRADTVYLLGGKSSFGLAYFLYFRLSKIGINCKLLHPGGTTLFSEMAPLGSGDVLLVIGFELIPREIVVTAKEAKRKKAMVIAVTSPPASEISLRADIALYADRGPRQKNRSMAGCLTVCTAVVAGVAARNRRRSARMYAQVDALENTRETSVREPEETTRRPDRMRKHA